MVGSTTRPFKPGPAWHWQQFGWLGIPITSPPRSTAWHEVQSLPLFGFMWLLCENSAFLGKSLFTDYLLPVELGGFLLLIATVGAIAISQRQQTTGRAP